MAELSKVITTASGVTTIDQPNGTIEVIREDGSSFVELLTDDGQGNATRVWLDRLTVMELVTTLAAAGYPR